MTIPSACIRRGIVAPGLHSRLKSIAARAFAEAADSGTPRRYGCAQDISFLTKSLQGNAQHPAQPALLKNQCSLNQTRQQFSTAVASKFSLDDDIDEYDMSSYGVNRQNNSTREMPRLQALRQRLRLEKKEGVSQHELLSSAPMVMEQPSIGDFSPSDIDLHENVDTKRVEINNSNQVKNILTDTHGRHHNYLRISLSERCNLRCQYCMPPEGVPLSPQSNILTNEEIIRLVDLFVKNGVNKVRLTGGEPLLRKNLVPLVQSISSALQMSNNASSESGLVGITTNAISLSRHIDGLVDAGLTSVNISLDTLREDRFLEITRRKGLDKVMRAIGDSIRAFQNRYGDVRLGTNGSGGSRVKINCVVMKGFNDDELSDFVTMANETFGGDIDMRFIEWMPFNDNGWNRSRFLSYQDMMNKISAGGDESSGAAPMNLERIGDGPNDTTKWWKVTTGERDTGRFARVGFITSMSDHFCSSCNRLRITADGKIKVCLFGSNEKEVSLRDIMRRHHTLENDSIEAEELSQVIHAAVKKKMAALGGHGNPDNIAKAANNRPMTLIGG